MAKHTQSKMWPEATPQAKKPAKKPAKKAKPEVLTRAQLEMLVTQYRDALDAQVQEIVNPVREKLEDLLDARSGPESAPVQRTIIAEVLRLLDCTLAGRGWEFTYRLKYDDPDYDLIDTVGRLDNDNGEEEVGDDHDHEAA